MAGRIDYSHVIFISNRGGKSVCKTESNPSMLMYLYQRCQFQMWILVYNLMMIVIVPSVISLAFSVRLFTYAQSLARQIQPQFPTGSTMTHTWKVFNVRRRDLKLLRRMTHMFCTFIGSWSPIYLTLIINHFIDISPFVIPVLIVLAEFAILVDIIKMYVANHELRHFFITKFHGCVRR